MDIKPVKSDADYRAALKEVESLMMAAPDTPEGEKLDVMVTLIEAYVINRPSISLVSPIKTWILFRIFCRTDAPSGKGYYYSPSSLITQRLTIFV